MSQNESRGRRSGFLDSLGRLFRASEPPAETQPAAPSGFAKLEAQFDAAIRGLNEKIEQQRGAAAGSAAGAVGAERPKTAEELAAERSRRLETVHRAMREDIEKMHARLGTGLSAADLDAIRALLEELDATAAAGRGSHDLLPRARYAIAEKLQAEAGELAVARVVALLGRQKLGWPDPSQPPPSATPEEIERSRRRRLADVRRSFLGEGFARTGDSLQGIIRGWGADYPEPGSPLWEACVLEAVAAGIRGKLVRDFVELLRREREQLLVEAEATVGKEIGALQQALAGGVHSLEQASRAVEGALRVLDEVLPAVAWERVRSQLPEARGQFA